MTTGAERADPGPAKPIGAAEEEAVGTWLDVASDSGEGRDWLGAPAADDFDHSDHSGHSDHPDHPDHRVKIGLREEPAEAPRSGGGGLLAAFFILLALGWVGVFGWSLWLARPAIAAPVIVSSIATLSTPLVLLALLWVLLGRSARRETERFTRAVEAMRSESIALQSVLEIVSGRIEDNHARLRGEAERLMTLGDEASDRLGRVTYYLAKESGNLDRQSAALESAAAAAKVDIGVLLHDLPKAEEQARAVADAMKDAGLAAHGHATALEAELSALSARGREADEILSGSAQRMAAHVARIESSASAAASSIGQASEGMNAAVDAAMTRAADAVDSARTSLDTQGAAVMAAIEHHRATLERAGEDSARGLAHRLDDLMAKVQTLAGHLAAQDAASHALVTGLAKELGELDSWFEQLGRTGAAGTEKLAEGLRGARESTLALIGELSEGGNRATELIGRTGEMADALSIVAGQLDGALPEALQRVEEQAGRTQESAAALVPVVDAVQASAEAAAERVAEAEASIARQSEALDSLIARVAEGGAGAEAQLRALAAAAAEAQETTARIAAETGPELIDALVRVREAASQAAERAREAIQAVIPQSAEALGEAGRQALGDAIGDTVELQMAELCDVSERAVTAAREASERLTRQMIALGETSATLEAGIEEEKREREARERDNLPRRVALLIESLNSTAIDVTKILSNEVTDSAWAAYLKGDRGVFTRRAVRLLDTVEAREIARHYEEEPEFREQVNRYIHDFEAMLRPILADRDGSALGITLLSSDMGKLYVALAQAIERLRT